jgi:hypothetical protein
MVSPVYSGRERESLSRMVQRFNTSPIYSDHFLPRDKKTVHVAAAITLLPFPTCNRAEPCPLSGVKRTSARFSDMSAYDPKRTLVIAVPAKILRRNKKLRITQSLDSQAAGIIPKVSTVDCGYFRIK